MGPQSSADADFVFIEVAVQLIDGTTNDGYFDNFGPYSLGGEGASFSFRQLIQAGFGAMLAEGNGDLSFAGFTYASNSGYSFLFVSNLDPYQNLSSLSFGRVGTGTDNRGDMAWNDGATFGTIDQFLEPGLSFVGFRFDLGNGTQYGFAEVIMDGQPWNSGFFVGYGYGGPGEAVFAGQRPAMIPEPASLGFLALGSVGLLAWRRKRSLPVID